MTPSPKRSQGFSLVEMLVVIAVGTLVLIALWKLYRMSNVTFVRARKRLTAVQGTLLFLDRMLTDVPQTLLAPEEGLAPDDDGSTVRFPVFDGDRSIFEANVPAIHRSHVMYAHDKPTGALRWTKDGRSGIFQLAPFEVLAFETAPSVAMGSASPQDHYLGFRITCAAEDDFAANQGLGDDHPDRRNTEVVTVRGCIGLHQQASRAAFPFWLDTPLPSSPGPSL